MSISRQTKAIDSAQSSVWLAKQMRTFMLAVSLLFGVTLMGTVGFILVEGWSLHDGLYMTIITLSTVGYGEVKPLTTNGQIFAMLLIMAGVLVVAYSVGIIASTALEGELYRYRGVAKMFKKIQALNNHIIICGYGRLAKFMIPDLLAGGHKIVVIDNNPMTLVELEAEGILYLEGNAFDDEVLQHAKVEKAAALLALLPSDSDNVFITLSARSLNPKVRILARTEHAHTETKLIQAGADQTFSAYRVGAARVVQQLLHPNISDFLELDTEDSQSHLIVEQINVPHDCPVGGQTIGELGIDKRQDITIAACSDKKGNMNLSPLATTTIEPGATVIALGTATAIKSFTSLVEDYKEKGSD